MCSPDVELIRRILSDDARAAGEFVSLWHPSITTWVRNLSSPEEVEDLVQEVFAHIFRDNWRVLSLWNGLDRTDGDTHFSLRAYLKVITRNKALDLIRRQGPQWRNEEVDIDGQPTHRRDESFEHTIWAHRIEAVERCVEALTRRRRRVVSHWLAGDSYREIGAKLGMNPNNVGVTLHQILRKLRRCLRESLPGDFPDE